MLYSQNTWTDFNDISFWVISPYLYFRVIFIRSLSGGKGVFKQLKSKRASDIGSLHLAHLAMFRRTCRAPLYCKFIFSQDNFPSNLKRAKVVSSFKKDMHSNCHQPISLHRSAKKLRIISLSGWWTSWKCIRLSEIISLDF